MLITRQQGAAAPRPAGAAEIYRLQLQFEIYKDNNEMFYTLGIALCNT
jgi:hypothetical protein